MRVHSTQVHCPKALDLRSADRHHPCRLVPSSWFLTTSTVCTAQRLRVCCAPLTVMRFVPFHTPPTTTEVTVDTAIPATLQACPAKGFPRPRPPHHVTAVPRPTTNPLLSWSLPTLTCSILPWALSLRHSIDRSDCGRFHRHPSPKTPIKWEIRCRNNGPSTRPHGESCSLLQSSSPCPRAEQPNLPQAKGSVRARAPNAEASITRASRD